jgi:hypothetical protein
MILRFEGPDIDDYSLCDTTKLTPDGPIDYLDDNDVENRLTSIEALPDPTPTLTKIGFF